VNHGLGPGGGYKNDQDEKSRSGFATFCQMGKCHFFVLFLFILLSRYSITPFI
jgi:hypothetical protein